MSVQIGLTCFHCRCGKVVEVDHEPQFAFEVAAWASEAGMFGIMDFRHQRALVFCNADHAKKELTKKGHYRLRAKGPKKEEV